MRREITSTSYLSVRGRPTYFVGCAKSGKPHTPESESSRTRAPRGQRQAWLDRGMPPGTRTDTPQRRGLSAGDIRVNFDLNSLSPNQYPRIATDDEDTDYEDTAETEKERSCSDAPDTRSGGEGSHSGASYTRGRAKAPIATGKRSRSDAPDTRNGAKVYTDRWK